MEKQIDPRHVARALAMQYLFTKLISKQPEIDISVLMEELEVEKYDEDLYNKITVGVEEKIGEIDPEIQRLAPAWPLGQIAPVDLTLLRMGLWEAFIAKLTPPKVVINEMIELGKEFGGENTSSFINGVLGAKLNNQNTA